MPYLFRAIQWLLPVAPTVISPRPVIARLVLGNPVAIASSTYRHFTSPRHALLVPGNPEDIALICFALLGSA